MSWEIEFTDQAREWIESLNDEDYDAMAGVIDLLGQDGPTLGRPAVDRIKGSRHQNMKELRSSGQYLRALGPVLLRPASDRNRPPRRRQGRRLDWLVRAQHPDR